jgi:anti-sigma factor (TIGR02949 family)
MHVINFENGQCKKIRAYLDSYINDELLVETNHEVIKHLEQCPECADELDARVRVKKMLQSSVRRDAAPLALRERIQKEIRRRPAYGFPRWALAAAAAVVLIVAGWSVMQLVRKPAAPSEVSIATAHPNAEILRIGLSDHVHCVLDSGFANRRFSLEEMTERFGADFIELVPALRERLAAGYEITVAHRCYVKGREFKHIILKNGDKVFSLIITRKNGEAFAHNDLMEVLAAGDVPVYGTQLIDEARRQQLEVAGFESRDYLAFVVSSAPRQENLEIASTLAPVVRGFLAKREA